MDIKMYYIKNRIVSETAMELESSTPMIHMLNQAEDEFNRM